MPIQDTAALIHVYFTETRSPPDKPLAEAEPQLRGQELSVTQHGMMLEPRHLAQHRHVCRRKLSGELTVLVEPAQAMESWLEREASDAIG